VQKSGTLKFTTVANNPGADEIVLCYKTNLKLIKSKPLGLFKPLT